MNEDLKIILNDLKDAQEKICELYQKKEFDCCGTFCMESMVALNNAALAIKKLGTIQEKFQEMEEEQLDKTF